MGSGLIWAGIGKGIADAGAAYGNAMFRVAEADLADQRALQRQETLDEIKRQRVIKDSAAAEAEATRIGEARTEKQLSTDANKIAGVASQVKGDSPAMSAEEIQQLIKDNPQYAETYRKAGLIDKAMTPNQQRIQAADDMVKGAMNVGASASVIEAYQKQRKDVLDQIREDNKEADRKREREQADRRLDLMEQRITTQNANDTTRANRPTGGSGGGGSLRVSKTVTDSQGNVVAVMSDGTTRDTGVKSGDFEKRVTAQINLMSKNDYSFSKLSTAEKRAKALEVVTATTPKPSDNPTNRPALDSFKR